MNSQELMRETESSPPIDCPIPRSIRVLCVDDNRDLANTVAMLLDFGGFDARTCYDGFDAVVEAIHFKPHVCLIDIMMPGQNGLAVARQIRQHYGSRPPHLIAVTAMGEDEHRQQVLEAGFHQYLIKPVAPDELLAAIAENCRKADSLDSDVN